MQAGSRGTSRDCPEQRVGWVEPAPSIWGLQPKDAAA